MESSSSWDTVKKLQNTGNVLISLNLAADLEESTSMFDTIICQNVLLEHDYMSWFGIL